MVSLWEDAYMSKTEKFRGVSLKRELVDAVERFVETHPNAGYKSISDFIHEAVRNRIQEVKQVYPSSS